MRDCWEAKVLEETSISARRFTVAACSGGERLVLREKRAIVASSAIEAARWIPTPCRLAPASPTHQAAVERGNPEDQTAATGVLGRAERRAERLLVLRAASPRRNSVNEAGTLGQRVGLAVL
jgi:hypothetical protein